MSTGLLAFASLLGSGCALQKTTNDIDKSTRLHKGEIPTGNTMLSSNGVDRANAQLQRKAAAAFASPNHIKSNTKELDTQHKGYFSSLAGVYMSEDEYKHTNMTPNFGSTVRQNTDPLANKSIIEMYTGVGETFLDKKEIAPLFAQQKDVTNINGQKSYVEFKQSRVVKPTIQNNIFPFESVKVGPGLAQGFTSTPSGGFQQARALDALKPKTIDQLRIASKAQVSYSTPQKAGAAYIKNRGSLPTMAKQRPETSANIPFEYQVGNAAAVMKETMYGCFEVPDTDRGYEQDYMAPAISKDKGQTLQPSVQEDRRREVLDHEVLGPANMAYHGNEDDDFGRQNIDVPMTTKELTVECSQPGILTSIVKAIVAPLQDVLKPSNKEFHIMAEREFGNLQPQMPAKSTTYDPSDVAKTTIKETTIHDADNLNLKGPERNYVLDPDKHRAKTTIKETLIHDEHSGVLTGHKCMAVYSVDAAKRTVRETLKGVDYNTNLKGPGKTTVPFSGKAKVTVRETTIRAARAGNIGTMGKGDGYKNQSYDLKYTQRNTTSHEYSGIADNSKCNQGYDIANVDAKYTQKQVLCDHEYYGASESTAKEMMSYLADENARIDVTKEMTLIGRDPTSSGVKTAIGKEGVGLIMNKHKQGCVEGSADMSNPRGLDKIVGRDMVTVPLSKQDFFEDDRIEMHAVEQLRSNPFAIRPFSR